MTLTRDQLEALHDAWRAQGAPIADWLAPGRAIERFESDDGTVAVELPQELQLWWSWHDGAAPSTKPVRRMLGPFLFYLSSNEARELWLTQLQIARRLAVVSPAGPLADPAYWWRPSWVPLTPDGAGYIAADCALAAPERAPIRRVEAGPDLDQTSQPRTDSLGQLVAWWTEAITLGVWTFDHTANGWRRTPRDPGVEDPYAGLA